MNSRLSFRDDQIPIRTMIVSTHTTHEIHFTEMTNLIVFKFKNLKIRQAVGRMLKMALSHWCALHTVQLTDAPN